MMMAARRPRPWAETNRQGRTRYVWRFGGQRYRTPFYDDPEDARADATAQITEQLQGTWQDESGRRMPLEEWIDVWAGWLDEVEPTTIAFYKYLVEFHILPAFQGRQLGTLTFEEIEAWDRSISKKINSQGRPYARSVASAARSLLITLLGDAVHAGKIDRNPAERRKGRRGRKRARGRADARGPGFHHERDHAYSGTLPGRTLRAAVLAGHRLRDEHLRRLDRGLLG
jgi:GNAT superfamily N-acetyltransferase